MSVEWKTKTVSLNLADILREKIDECARFKRDLGPYSEVMGRVMGRTLRGDNLSEEEEKESYAAFLSLSLKLFLESKEGLVIPDDALYRAAAQFIDGTPDVDLTFAYEDFYAYQFVDKLNDIIRRAFTVRDLFAQVQPHEKIKHLCSEAYQCYLYGYHTASVTLIRTLIETALKDRLSLDVSELWKLNDEGLKRGLYPEKIWLQIDQIRKEGNRFVHGTVGGETPSETKNLTLLGFAQEILQVLMPPATRTA